ncbi:MAG: hypothetical protein GC131_00800 [Alphaproteobacteria bacterium]|nr:hypothetical protein [Alphaproteobacteria bacterium]
MPVRQVFRLIMLLACALGATALPGRALAQRVDELPGAQSYLSDRIAAIVNDSAITGSDVENRYHLALVSSGMTESAEARKRIMPQVIQSLIDEQIQMQEARRLDITIGTADVDQALEKIAADNGITTGMRLFLASQGVSPATLEDQVRASLSWVKVVQRTLRPRVEIGDDEVDAVIDRMRASSGKQEYLVSEIFLPNDNPAEEAQAQAFAEQIKKQIDQGAPFVAVARQFSQGTGAMNGGDLGWIQQGQLPGEIDSALKTMNEGEIAGPIKTSSGFHIIAVRSIRTINIGEPGEAAASVAQISAQVTPPQDRAAVMEQAKTIRTALVGCTDLEKRLSGYSGWRYQNMGQHKLDEFPEWLAEIVNTQKIGEASAPVPTGAGITMFYVCNRAVPDSVDRDAIANAIGLERLENLARRKLRDLKRAAYIDIRT